MLISLSARVWEANERVSRSVSSMKKARFTERATAPVSSVTFTPHTHCLHQSRVLGGSSSSSAPPQATSAVQRERLGDSDDRIGSKKLMLSESGSLPSGAPMSADLDLSNDDMKVRCLLDRFERERIASKSHDPLVESNH